MFFSIEYLRSAFRRLTLLKIHVTFGLGRASLYLQVKTGLSNFLVITLVFSGCVTMSGTKNNEFILIVSNLRANIYNKAAVSKIDYLRYHFLFFLFLKPNSSISLKISIFLHEIW